MISKHMGMDIWALLSFIFLVLTCILMINKERIGIQTALVQIQLARGESAGAQAEEVPEYIICSVKKTHKGKQLYLGDRPVARGRLHQELKMQKQKGVTVLITRFDEELPHGDYVRILDSAQKAGIQEIYDVYQKQEGGESK